MAWVELRQIRYAVAVAEELHFGRAARRLHMTQPSLSRQIRTLEHEIGCDLFERTSRGAALTPAGAEFAAQARRTLQTVESGIRRTQDVGRGARGHVSLGFVATAALDVLPQALLAHRTQRPGVVVTLSELTTEQQVEALLAQDLDVGLGRDVRATDGLRTDIVRREPVVVALPRLHALAQRADLSVEDLAGEAVVKLPRNRARLIDGLLDRIPTMGLRGQTRTRAVVQEANQYMTLLALVAADIGLALVPESVRVLQPEGIRYVRLADPMASTALTVTTRLEGGHPAADNLRSLLLKEFGAQ